MIDVSFVITSYNYDYFIKECILSCLNQINTQLVYEVLVVDDGSIDQTDTILGSILSDKIRIYKIQNSGIEVASNFGFQNAKGKFVIRVDADDSIKEDFLSKFEKYKDMNADFYFSNYDQIDSYGNKISEINLPDFNRQEIFQRGDFLATGTIYRKDLLEKMGFYTVDEKNSGLENYELILKIISNGGFGVHIKDNLFSYRRHSLNLSEVKRDKIIAYGRQLFKKMGYGTFNTNEYHPYGLKI